MTVALEQAFTSLQTVQDRAFIQALCYGVCRYYHRLDFILSRLLDKPLKDTSIRLLVLIGLYQLAFMRIKEHAAVAETVSAAGRKPWAKGLINALLRRYLREQDQLEALADADYDSLLRTSVTVSDLLDWYVDDLAHDPVLDELRTAIACQDAFSKEAAA